MVVECSKCEISIVTEVLIEHKVIIGQFPEDELKFSLLKCPKCSFPILVEQSYEIESDNFTGLRINLTEPRILYPSTEFHINPEIPSVLKLSLEECIRCLKSKSYTATVIMYRRVIEGFCEIQGIKSNNLSKAIIMLKDQKIINDQIFDWANELRLSGNDAAHNIDQIFKYLDAKDILDFTIAILDYTYSLKEKFEKFKERRNPVTNRLDGPTNWS